LGGEPSATTTRADARPWHAPLRFALGVALAAMLAAAFAVGFRSALAWVFSRMLRAGDIVSAMQAAPWWVRVSLPALGGLLAGVMGSLSTRKAHGHGVSDVMEAVVLGRVRLAMAPTLLKSLASFLAIASGGSLGREGPLIQFGASAGKVVSERLGLSAYDARRLIAAGTAAGFAAAYNTPFAAVLFVLEVVTGVVVLEAIIPVLVATVIAAECTRLLVGEGPIYGARAFTLHSSFELLAFGVVGVVGALAAQGFMRLLSGAESMLRETVRLPYRSALGGLACGLVVALLPSVAGNGYEPLNDILSARLALVDVLLFVSAKALATSASVGSGSPGGVFTPTMVIGGGLGYACGVAAQAVFGASVGSAGGYALVGMAATTAASTHAPLMAAVMAFELSGDYAIALPLCLATAVATALSRVLRKDSIYTAELRARGLGWQLTMEGRRVDDAAPPGDTP